MLMKKRMRGERSTVMSFWTALRNILPSTNRNFEERMDCSDRMMRQIKHENQMLRYAVEKLTCEVNDLRKRHRYFNGEYLSLHATEKNKILIAGWYGADNLGDELMLRSVLEHFPSDYLDRVYVLLWDNELYERSGLDYRCNVIHYPPSVWDLEILADSFDAVVWGGGAILDDSQYNNDPYNFNTGNLFIRLSEQMLAKGKRVYALGLSTNAVLGSESYIQHLSRIISSACVFSLRDPYSLETLKHAGVDCSNVTLCEDLVFAYSDIHQLGDRNNMKHKPVLGVVLLCTEDSYSDNLSILSVLTKSELLSKEGYEISLIPFLGEGSSDEKYYQRLIDELPETEIPIRVKKYFPSLKESPLLECSLVVSSKYHASLISDIARIPNISIWSEAHPHYRNKMTHLSEIAGVPQTLLSLSEARKGSVMEDALSSLLGPSAVPFVSRDFLERQSDWLKGICDNIVESTKD